jgi:hypothetical protein
MLLISKHIELTATLCLDKTGGHQGPDGRDIDMAGLPSHPDTGTTGQDFGPHHATALEDGRDSRRRDRGAGGDGDPALDRSGRG